MVTPIEHSDTSVISLWGPETIVQGEFRAAVQAYLSEARLRPLLLLGDARLVQMHHKIQTFEHVNKKLVLVIQDKLLIYMARQFNFGHIKNPAVIGDSMHLHVYRLNQQADGSFKPLMQSRLSTDAEGIGICLGLQAEARVALEQILQALQAKLSSTTLFVPRF